MLRKSYFFVGFVLAMATSVLFYSCNKNCSSLQSTYGGKVVGMYDFKSCFVYARLDSNIIINSDTAFQRYKDDHFINCNAVLDNIDFSKNALLGFRTKAYGCNVAFHRIVEIDDALMTYTFKVKIETCGGCGTELTSPNWVVAPQIPVGYKVIFKTENF